MPEGIWHKIGSIESGGHVYELCWKPPPPLYFHNLQAKNILSWAQSHRGPASWKWRVSNYSYEIIDCGQEEWTDWKFDFHQIRPRNNLQIKSRRPLQWRQANPPSIFLQVVSNDEGAAAKIKNYIGWLIFEGIGLYRNYETHSWPEIEKYSHNWWVSIWI